MGEGRFSQPDVSSLGCHWRGQCACGASVSSDGDGAAQSRPRSGATLRVRILGFQDGLWTPASPLGLHSRTIRRRNYPRRSSERDRPKRYSRGLRTSCRGSGRGWRNGGSDFSRAGPHWRSSRPSWKSSRPSWTSLGSVGANSQRTWDRRSLCGPCYEHI